jgi:hypothetical protein
VSVETLMGTQVLREEMVSSNGQFKSNLDLHTLPAGLYLVRFSSGNHTALKRLVINR